MQTCRHIQCIPHDGHSPKPTDTNISSHATFEYNS